MKLKLISYLVFCVFGFSFSQNFKGNVGIYQSTDMYTNMLDLRLEFGGTVYTSIGKFNVFGVYDYGGNIPYENTSFFKLNYHMLGLGAGYGLFNDNKIYNPNLKFMFLTETFSSYRSNHLIFVGGYQGTNFIFFPKEDEVYPRYDLTTNQILYWQSYDYISTPLLGRIQLSNEFLVYEGLKLSADFGYLFRAVRAYHKKWGTEDPEPVTQIVETHKFKKTSNGFVEYSHYFEFGVGISYSFPFKKKTKE